MTDPGKRGVDALEPARRAVLLLLTSQGRSYADLAKLLSTDERSIRRRAFEAADELLSDAPAAPASDVRERLVDYALGQQGVADRQRTRELLAESPIARDWIAGLERTLGIERPEPPSPSEPDAGVEPAQEQPPLLAAEIAEALAASHARVAELEQELENARAELGRSHTVAPPQLKLSPEPAPSPPPARSPVRPPAPLPARAPARGPLLGPRTYLTIGVVAVILGIVLLVVGADGHDHAVNKPVRSARAGDPASARPVQIQIALWPAGPDSQATGTADVVRQGSRLLMTLHVTGLGGSPSDRYAAWLEGPQGAHLLGFVQASGTAGTFAGAAGLPANATTFTTLVVTRETDASPSEPGPRVLRAPLPKSSG
jgi:hypothetical protein